MQQFWVEGLFITKASMKKAKKQGKLAAAGNEPFAKAIWAESPEEAIRMATEELNGGQWTEGPTVGKTTEEQHMRQLGAPELPGFGSPKKKRK